MPHSTIRSELHIATSQQLADMSAKKSPVRMLRALYQHAVGQDQAPVPSSASYEHESTVLSALSAMPEPATTDWPSSPPVSAPPP